MSKFSKVATKKYNHPISADPQIQKTVNFEGGEAFTLPLKQRLASRLLTSLVNENNFYGDNTLELLSDINEIAKSDPVFLLKLAAYARNVMYMRSVPIYALANASLINESKPYIRSWTPHIVKRGDEPAEVLAIINSHFTSKNQKPVIPASIKKGLADVVSSFNAYTLMKYKGKGNSVNLWDVFNICHPKPSTLEQTEVWKKFMNSELESANTWEVNISRDGSTKESWEKTIPVMGYMALLRNLRNFIDKEISVDSVKFVVSKLTNVEQVKNSKQLPFRFFSAWRELSNSERLYNLSQNQDALTKVFVQATEQAFDISCSQVSQLEGITAIFSDHSGSMEQKISSKSKVTRKDICMVLHAIADKKSDANVGLIFGSRIKRVNSQGLSSMRFVEKLLSENVGHSTDIHLCFNYLIKNNIKVDRIIVLSDMQCYNSFYETATVDSLWNLYRKNNPNTHLHSVDLAGYGTSMNPANSPNVHLYAGWTNKFLDLINYSEKGLSTLVKEIENYNPNISQEIEEIEE